MGPPLCTELVGKAAVLLLPARLHGTRYNAFRAVFGRNYWPEPLEKFDEESRDNKKGEAMKILIIGGTRTIGTPVS